MEQQWIILAIIGAFVFRKHIFKAIGMDKPNPSLNILKDRIKVLEDRLNTIKPYNDSSLTKSVSAINMNISKLIKNQRIFHNQLSVLKEKSKQEQLKEPVKVKKKRIPPPRPRVEIPVEKEFQIVEYYGNVNSIRKTAKHFNIPKSRVEKCLKGMFGKKTDERTTYIG